jgi:hypothetical protein
MVSGGVWEYNKDYFLNNFFVEKNIKIIFFNTNPSKLFKNTKKIIKKNENKTLSRLPSYMCV